MSSHPRTLRDRILASARQILADDGPDALTMDALAAAVGASRATVYRHLGSREALIALLAAEGRDVGPRADVRARVLDAAGRAFGRSGFDGATVDEIAELAGVGVATVYRHFGDKEGLIVAFANERGGRAAVRDATARLSGDLRADLHALAREVLTAASSDADMLRLALIERARDPDRFRRLHAAPEGVGSTLARLFARYVETGQLAPRDPDALATAFSGALIAGAIIRPMLTGAPPPDPESFARFFVDLFLDGALPKEAPCSRPEAQEPRPMPGR